MLKTLIAWNSKAGSVQAAAGIRSYLKQQGNTTIVEPADGTEAERLVKYHCANGAELVIAAGGDGTINSVINGQSGARGVTGRIAHWNCE